MVWCSVSPRGGLDRTRHRVVLRRRRDLNVKRFTVPVGRRPGQRVFPGQGDVLRSEWRNVGQGFGRDPPTTPVYRKIGAQAAELRVEWCHLHCGRIR